MSLRQAVKRLPGWLHAHRRVLGIGVIGLAVLSIAVQLVYPYGRALPFASVAGQSISYKTRPEVTLVVQDRFANATVTVQSGDKKATDKLTNLGARVDVDQMASHAVEYPFLFRFVPFSLLWYQPSLDRYRLDFDASRLEAIAAAQVKELSVEPTDAGLTINDGKLDVVAARSGHNVELKELMEAIKTTRFNWDETIVTVAGSEIQPSVSDASIADVRQQAEAVLDQRLIITVEGYDAHTPDRATVASWLSLVKGDNGSVALGINDKALTQYADRVSKATATQPTATIVITVDGKETDRKRGKSGQGVVVAELKRQLANAIELPASGERTIAAVRKPIQPPVTYDRSYTSSQAGLSAYVRDMADSGKIYISVRQLSGSRWAAEGNATQSIASASTYKPMLMLKVLDDVDARKLKWDDTFGGDSLTDCFERMIVLSANECAEELIKHYGVSELTAYLHGRGFSKGTGFTFKEVTQTTAADLTKLMTGIENSTLLRGRHKSMMLEKMSRQIYRQGIPAGSSAPVYNKVGFLWNFLHDTAIVRHPQGTYVLTVMTEGESWAKIAEITREIERILYG